MNHGEGGRRMPEGGDYGRDLGDAQGRAEGGAERADIE